MFPESTRPTKRCRKQRPGHLGAMASFPQWEGGTWETSEISNFFLFFFTGPTPRERASGSDAVEGENAVSQ